MTWLAPAMKTVAAIRKSVHRISVRMSPTSDNMAVNLRSKSSTASSEDFNQSPRKSTSSSDKAIAISYSQEFPTENTPTLQSRLPLIVQVRWSKSSNETEKISYRLKRLGNLFILFVLSSSSAMLRYSAKRAISTLPSQIGSTNNHGCACN